MTSEIKPTDQMTRAELAAEREENLVADTAYVEQVAAWADASGINLMAATGDGGVLLRLVTHVRILTGITEAFAAMLDGTGARNYVEQEFISSQSGKVVAKMTLHRPGRPTPHELRMAAQEETARLIQEVTGFADFLELEGSRKDKVIAGRLREIVANHGRTPPAQETEER